MSRAILILFCIGVLSADGSALQTDQVLDSSNYRTVSSLKEAYDITDYAFMGRYPDIRIDKNFSNINDIVKAINNKDTWKLAYNKSEYSKYAEGGNTDDLFSGSDPRRGNVIKSTSFDWHRFPKKFPKDFIEYVEESDNVYEDKGLYYNVETQYAKAFTLQELYDWTQ